MEIPPIDTADALGLARDNNRLLKENNELLKKMEKRYVRSFWFKVVWFIILFVLPLLLLPYFFNSYLSSLGLSSGTDTTAPTADTAQQLLDLLRNNQSNPR